jgi:hypothetical protein
MLSRLFPALSTVDGWLAGLLPFVLRLMIWGALGGSLSILIYARLSPQASIKRLKKKMRGLQREMLGLDLQFADFLKLSGENLKTSLRLFAVVLGPGLVSVLPVLLFAVWIHTCMAYNAPASRGDLVAATADGSVDLRVTGENNSDTSPGGKVGDDVSATSDTVVIMADGEVVYSGTPLSPPTPVLHKRRWWSVILGSPAGYVVDDAPVDSIRLNLAKKQALKWGPGWARGWELPFFVFVFIAALGLKLGLRIA